MEGFLLYDSDIGASDTCCSYLNSYLSEKANRFRFFCVSRKGNLKYIVQKGLAIALSGTAVLAFSEMLFAVITGLLTQHDISIEFIQGIVSFKEDFFWTIRCCILF